MHFALFACSVVSVITFCHRKISRSPVPFWKPGEMSVQKRTFFRDDDTMAKSSGPDEERTSEGRGVWGFARDDHVAAVP